GDTWTAHGVNAPVLYAADTIVVDGTLDAGANTTTGGPGGENGGIGAPSPGMCFGNDGRYKFSNTTGAGGGGGGGATAGGAGAAAAPDAQGAPPGGPGRAP